MAKNPLHLILDSNKLTGPNYSDWLRNLRIVLDSEKRSYVLTAPPPVALPTDSSDEERATFDKWVEDNLQARCLMLASMSSELQKQHENMSHASDIHLHLSELYSTPGRQERYLASKELFQARMIEGSSVREHGLKMIGLIEKLAHLNVVMDNELYMDLILQSLPRSFDNFVMNFNMHNMEVGLHELVNMLHTAESSLVKEKHVMLAPSSSKGRKAKGKKKKGKSSSKDKKPLKATPKVAKGKVPKGICFHCNKEGHWKRNCPLYLKTVPNKNQGIFFVEVNISVNNANWVLDTACGSHLCNDKQVMRTTRPLEPKDWILRLGNGAKVAAEAIGDVELDVGHCKLVLRDCLYVPTLIKNLISIPVLDQEGFCFTIMNGNF
jgi:hypothetical protein